MKYNYLQQKGQKEGTEVKKMSETQKAALEAK